MADGARDRTESRGKRSLRDDRGMTAIEFVILTPLLFLLLMLTVQFALYLFAKQAATAAVQDGARTAREEAASKGCTDTTEATGSWQQDAVTAAVSRAQALGGQLILKPAVTTGFTMDPALNADCKISLVRVDLHSAVPSVFPGWTPTIDVHAGGPLEQPVRHP
jgi:Flp pilus assembly protein TadG